MTSSTYRDEMPIDLSQQGSLVHLVRRDLFLLMPWLTIRHILHHRHLPLLDFGE